MNMLYLKLDGFVVWQQLFTSTDGYYWKICGSSLYEERALFIGIELNLNHSNTLLEIICTTDLNEPMYGIIENCKLINLLKTIKTFCYEQFS
ncbi:unnamed protein product [Paramecium octaurelia]|uniref:Uncharacterized protein n=1 Tax=Paramecium octaurelia TaxID=43137 RepID=A0A8S1V157_PAROT|nr:unnamed protein product [Paramecium octaurelia]